MTSCTTVLQEQQVIVNSVSFESSTRSGYKSIILYRTKVFISNNHRTESFILENGEWDVLMNALARIDVSHLGNFDVSSNDRSRDVAWHSNIIIDTKDDVSYESKTFDDDKCPDELEELMKLMKEVDEKYNKKNRVF